MNKITEKRNPAEVIVILLVLFFGAVGGALVFQAEFEQIRRGIDYCKEQGWDGINGDLRCFKEVPHESGVGVVEVLSGKISRSILEGKND